MAKLTTVFGAPVVDNQNIRTAGARGPALLEDVWFLEKLAHFDREVIPERRMHATGVRRIRHFHRHARHHAIHAGKDFFGDRQEDRDVCTLFDRCRRARCG